MRLALVVGMASALPSEARAGWPSVVGSSEADARVDTFTGSGIGWALAGRLDLDGDGLGDVVVGTQYGFLVYAGDGSGLSSTPAATVQGDVQDNGLGRDLSTAGDVDGDGYDDLVAGSKGYDEDRGRVYLFLGSGAGIVASSASEANATITGEAEGDSFGGAVAGGGDLDGDGFADVLVGAAGNGDGAGKVYAFLGAASGLVATDTTGAAVEVPGDSAGDGFGGAVALAGDVNGDGLADAWVGAPGCRTYTGCAYLVPGSPFGLAYTPGEKLQVLASDAIYDKLGTAATGAGDVNADGLADLLVGASGRDRGWGYVIHGAPEGVSPGNIDVADTRIEAKTAYYFGAAVAAAGDLDGDGFDDVIIGDGYNTGIARIFGGSPTGIAATSTDDALLEITGQDNWEYVGYAATALGDIDGDGLGDIALGAPGREAYAGAVYIFHGPLVGEATRTTDTAEGTLAGRADNDGFGRVIASGGDLDGDGLGDIVVSASLAGDDFGLVAAFAGTSAGLPGGIDDARTQIAGDTWNMELGSSLAVLGDVDGDGLSDLAVASETTSSSAQGEVRVFYGTPAGIVATAPGDADAWLTGGSETRELNGTVAGPGDLDGDGFDDLVVGAPGARSYAGACHVVYGSAAGLPSGDNTVIDHSILGVAAGDELCGAVVGAGDVDGDGYPDLVAGGEVIGGAQGAVYLFRGGSGGLAAATAADADGSVPGDDNCTGAFATALDAGDINGDGYQDILVGDEAYLGDLGRAWVFCGSAAGLAAVTTADACATISGLDQSRFGYSVATGGDVDGDGFDDVLVAADPIPSGDAAVFLFLGSSTGITPAGVVVDHALGADTTFVYDGTEVSQFGTALALVDLDGNGADDVVAGDGFDRLSGAVLAFLGRCSAPLTRYRDADRDGFGNAAEAGETCGDPTAYVDDATDCDDDQAAVSPVAEEQCDGIDNDCDGVVDGPDCPGADEGEDTADTAEIDTAEDLADSGDTGSGRRPPVGHPPARPPEHQDRARGCAACELPGFAVVLAAFAGSLATRRRTRR